MSGLAALISIFRLAVGVQGSVRDVCLMGVMWASSEGAPFLLISKVGRVDSADFSGVDFLFSAHMFSCDGDSYVIELVQVCLNKGSNILSYRMNCKGVIL